MALEASLIAGHSRLQLIVGPLLEGSWIVVGFVHLVTGKARKVTPLVTGRFDQPVVFSTRHANHAVGPKTVLHEVRIALCPFLQAWLFGDPSGANGVACLGQIVARSVPVSVIVPIPSAVAIWVKVNPMTLSAHL